MHDRENHGDALRREILEELNTGIVNTRRIFYTAHAYAERTVELHFYRGDLTAEPRAALGQELRWITREEFRDLEFPPADAELIDGLMNASL